MNWVLFSSLCLLCKAVTNLQLNQVDVSYPKLTDSEFNVVQSVPIATLLWQPQNIDTNSFITFELKLKYPQDGNVNLLFTASKNSVTEVTEEVSGIRVSASYADFNGYRLKKDYHFLSISPQSFRAGDQLFFSIFLQQVTQPYEYTLKIIKTQEYQCPRDCTSPLMGTCEKKDARACICQTGLVDLDCSRKAYKLAHGTLLTNVPVVKSEYFYYDRSQEHDFGVLLVEILGLAPSGNAQVYYMYEDFENGVPSQGFYNNTNPKQLYFEKDGSRSETIDLRFLTRTKLQRYSRLLITVKATNAVFVNIIIKDPSSDDEISTNLMLVYFLVGLAIILLLTWIIITLIRYKNQRNARIHDEARVQQLNGAPHPKKKDFTIQFLNKYIPELTYQQLISKNDFKAKYTQMPQDENCPVCLEEFAQKNTFRFTPCHHIFHSQCLLDWLKKHDTCPNCREELSKESLEANGRNILRGPNQ